jgi:aryl-alcohol dehydrogenase-like predicted oxidoreductase
MQTDYLDILQFHFSPAKAVLEQEGAIETLQDLKQAGKIRFIGCSSILPHLVDHIGMGVFDVLQIPYSALQPEHEAFAILAQEQDGVARLTQVSHASPHSQIGRLELAT